MHIAVRMSAGDPRTGEFRDTSHALVIVAAIDADGDATDVRPWVPTTAEDIALDAHARALIGLRREVPAPRSTCTDAFSAPFRSRRFQTPPAVG